SRGTISSLGGIKDDVSQFQISVPTQGGNSGGPLIDSTGSVVGIVDSRLNDRYMIATYGTIPQNVCYAIKGSRINNLLKRFPDVGNKVVKAKDVVVKPFTDLYESAKASVVRIEAVAP